MLELSADGSFDTSKAPSKPPQPPLVLTATVAGDSTTLAPDIKKPVEMSTPEYEEELAKKEAEEDKEPPRKFSCCFSFYRKDGTVLYICHTYHACRTVLLCIYCDL